MSFVRIDGRTPSDVRPVNIQYDLLGYADASVFFELGQTKILVSASIKDGVPQFLKGSKTGWLTAEYAMLPCATQERTIRDGHQNNRNHRGIEISRLVGRCLRSVVDLSVIGERTITIDCDVLQADGSTRVASITAASLALELAAKRWVNAHMVPESFFKESIAAVSAGLVNTIPCVDICYQEDNTAVADFNFVISRSNHLVEVQGTSEKHPLAWDHFDQLRQLAVQGVTQIFQHCQEFPFPEKTIIPRGSFKPSYKAKASHSPSECIRKEEKKPLFSLANRMAKPS